MTTGSAHSQTPPQPQVASDVPFYVGLCILGGAYVLLIVGMLVAEALHTTPGEIGEALQVREIQYSIKLSLLTCGITTVLALWVSVPIGYLMSRHEFRGKAFVDAVLDIPIVLPPLVIGLCLLILFNTPVFNVVESWLHGLERLTADNLVPAGILLLGAVLSTVAFVVMRRWVPSAPVRLAVVGTVTAAAFLAGSWSWLFPRLPGGIASPEEFESIDVDKRDQSPLRASRHVWSAEYAFTGTASELDETLRRTYAADGYKPVIIAQTSRDKRLRSGRRQAFVELAADATESIPAGSELEFDARPAETLTHLKQTGVNPETDRIDWRIRLDVVRARRASRTDFRPKFTFPVTYAIPSVILAQFMVACAFAVRTMRVTFDQIHPRFEQVALTLGCNRSQAFWRVVLPQARRGMLAAATLAWARSLGEFGPILIFSGSTRMKTEVLPTTVFLELNNNNLSRAVAASLIMVIAAVAVLVIARVFGLKKMAI